MPVAAYEGTDHEDVLSLRFGGTWQNDEYLSPMLYDGLQGALQNEWWQGFRADSTNSWHHTGNVALSLGRLYNNRRSNRIMSFGLQGGWGAVYGFGRMIGVDGLNVFLGPYIGAEMLVSELATNVNKPYSVDIAFLLKAMAGVEYSFAAKHTSYRLRYALNTPLAGIMFVPEYGQSYYEVTEAVLAGTLHFAGPHNRRALTHSLTLDLQFKHSAWRLGVEHNIVYYRANSLSFSREQVSLVVGTVFNYRTSVRSFR